MRNSPSNTLLCNASTIVLLGNYNTANGYYALLANTTGTYNTANGYYALFSNTTGGRNTSLGYQAGRYISGGSISNATSSNSLYLGYNTMALASGDTNEIVIGNGTVGLGSNTTVIGSSTATTLTALYGNVGIGTTSPNASLEVNGPSLFDSGVTIASIEYLNSAKTPISGTAGAITWTEPYQGNSDKRVYVQLNGYTNASPTTIVFTQAFTSTPALTANTTGLGTPTATASQIIISAATLVTGWFIYEGF